MKWDQELADLHEAYDRHEPKSVSTLSFYGYSPYICRCGQILLRQTSTGFVGSVTRQQAAGFIKAVRHWQRRHDKDDADSFKLRQLGLIGWMMDWEVNNHGLLRQGGKQ